MEKYSSEKVQRPRRIRCTQGTQTTSTGERGPGPKTGGWRTLLWERRDKLDEGESAKTQRAMSEPKFRVGVGPPMQLGEESGRRSSPLRLTALVRNGDAQGRR